MPNDYDENCEEYDATLKAVFAATQNDPTFFKQDAKSFDWDNWTTQHPDLVASHSDHDN